MLPPGETSFRFSGSISEGSICSCSGTVRPSCGRRGRNRKNTSPAMNTSRAARALQTIEVGEPFGVGLVGPVEPELLHLRLQPGLRDQRRRLDAGTDHVTGPALDGVCGIAVVAHEPASTGGDVGTGRRDQRVEMRPARLETPEPAIRKPRLEAADERPDAASEMRQRRQHFKVPSRQRSGSDDDDRRCRPAQCAAPDR